MYYNSNFEQYISDVKGIWAVINDIIRKNKCTTKKSEYMFQNNKKVFDKQVIANMFNDFYINIGPKLANAIDVNNIDVKYDTYLKDLNVNKSMFIEPSTEEEIAKIISGFKSKNSQDIHGISMLVIKQISDTIVKPLNIICNLAFSTGVFPSKMKTAKLLPLFKANDAHEVSNYRPVSILTQFSKILEKCSKNVCVILLIKTSYYLMVSMVSE